jgi:S1-C subfamily serine protease
MLALLLIAALGLGSYVGIDSVKDHSEDVMVDVQDSIFGVANLQGRGTGWVTTAKSGRKVLVTNVHVCDSQIPVMFTQKGNHKYMLNVLGKDSKHDICILEAPKGAPALPLAANVVAEEQIYSVGFPLIEFMTSQSGRLKGYTKLSMPYELPLEKCTGAEKYSIQTLKVKQDDGTVTEEKTCIFTARELVTTIPMDDGGSGSPILNADEEVVGMTMIRAGNLGWAGGVPLSDLKRVLSKY